MYWRYLWFSVRTYPYQSMKSLQNWCISRNLGTQSSNIPRGTMSLDPLPYEHWQVPAPTPPPPPPSPPPSLHLHVHTHSTTRSAVLSERQPHTEWSHFEGLPLHSTQLVGTTAGLSPAPAPNPVRSHFSHLLSRWQGSNVDDDDVAWCLAGQLANLLEVTAWKTQISPSIKDNTMFKFNVTPSSGFAWLRQRIRSCLLDELSPTRGRAKSWFVA